MNRAEVLQLVLTEHDFKVASEWLSEDWAAQHQEARDRRMMMQGVSHHQGSRNLAGYAQAYV
jgi:hypothetical protein